MKDIFNKYIIGVFVVFVVSKYVVFADYEKFVESNVEHTIVQIESKFSKAKEIAVELEHLKSKNCNEMILSLQKVTALNPAINSISIIRDGRYYCSSLVGLNISKKEVPQKEIHIKEKNVLTGLPAISYYHQYDGENGIQFFMKGVAEDLKESRVGNVLLSNEEYTLSSDNQFGEHSVNGDDTYESNQYDFIILLNYNVAVSIKHYLIDNRFFIAMVLFALLLAKVLSIKSSIFNYDYYKLKKVIKRHQIKPFVQPVVNEKEEIVGGEVLARWITSTGKVISPLDFIPKIEKYGLMGSMTKSILTQLNEYKGTSGYHGLRISVNLTEMCLYNEEIYSLCCQLAKKCTLVLEFTESTEFENRTKIISYMQKFRDIGVKFALDDYGTGYSSLQYLNYYQFDFVKIDKSFIDDIEINSLSLKILENIILLANNLDIKLVAEGVENKNQQQILNELQISSHQGFLYFKPMPLQDFNTVVKGK
ncbi:EAL domain-containing protein [Aliivibrio finisterrensis]|uniref:cyclic-guanylate-specific phosphodiesterase n=1 Tax=Aliivibrio finisterrensis TaxID=511998 RepID=A0ABY0IBY2_9GAMM|nr:EAL domain-containing protein [Aliivibrio finisterrensis]RYU66839.1 EAL domain-containing protein [Aliivibrio finisterrensis]RYU70447.1 EAL domain-containing protein [Aliivibrio finisterrensis]RYU74309.1 EAL domain-containing protein [Aliivibrio finisterrensis]RYU76914.1 EAL domain-containing protein [Aliivibrio finisterrensis]RYU88620.1 EAL domain-containing protein [Aliivibrio finisterrensis]